jgi:hypothetical protein
MRVLANDGGQEDRLVGHFHMFESEQICCAALGQIMDFQQGDHMPNKTPCFDCVDLVGAGPARGPHHSLQASAVGSRKESAFQCSACGFRWARRPLGWAAIFDLEEVGSNA